ncbi:MAG TPA: cytochrome c [Rhizomicrobium sp.]|jgi:mono/diheme cytochrome c family protein
MTRDHWMLLMGAAAALVLVAVIAAIFAFSGIYDVAADSPHAALTKMLIATARERSIESRLSGVKVPPLEDAHMIADGAADYDAMCTACHLAPGMAENEMRPGMNPKPPVLWRFKHGDPREQFWVIKHGIKMTGMPAWGVTHSDEEIWNMVAFLQKLPSLSPAQYHTIVASGGDHHDHDHMDMH